MAPVTRASIYEAIAKSLLDFGYPDCTTAMVKETHEAMKRGDAVLPHGVISMFAKAQLEPIGDSVLDQLPEA